MSSVMSDTSENLSLPPGWDAKYDFKTGKRYYINHFTKHTSLEDPRIKYKKLQAGEPMAFPSYQSSPIRSFSPQPFYHLHQDTNYSSGRPSPIMSRSYSPLMGSNALHYLAQKPHEYPTLETSVAKIKSLFPTVGETHIKALLHKYHYREAVVMSALQVEKHPITTPGPYSSPLSAARHVISQIAPSAPGSPGRFSFSSAFRNLSPRRTPHSSPKMKLRYLKGMFPVVDEMVLLDTLTSSENNVHKATEKLTTMGFMKKDGLPFKHTIKKEEETYSIEKDLKNDSIFISLHDPCPKLRSYEEKARIKKNLEAKFDKIPEQVIGLALETADYDEERAEQFLNATICDEKKQSEESCDLIIKEKQEESHDNTDGIKIEDKPFRDSGIWEKVSPDSLEDKTTATPSSSVEQPEVQRDKEDSDSPHVTCTTTLPVLTTPVTEEPQRSQNNTLRSKTGIKLCAKLIPKGPNKSLLLSSRCAVKGPNADLPKGPTVKNTYFSKKHVGSGSQTCKKEVHNGECAIF